MNDPSSAAVGDPAGRKFTAPTGWNHNTHYHRLIFDSLPPRFGSALDVGCGDGALIRQLSNRVDLSDRVVGIDRDAPIIESARRHRAEHQDRIEYLLGDVLTHPFEVHSFDVITCVATVHHLDAQAGLTRLRELLRPGGTMVIVGCARSRFPGDLPRELVAVLANRWRLRRSQAQAQAQAQAGQAEPTAPVLWPPPLTYRQMRRLAERLLPGVRYRRHLYWRYSLVWTAPVAGAGAVGTGVSRPAGG